MVTLTADNVAPEPKDVVRMRLRVQDVNGGGAGFFVSASQGQFRGVGGGVKISGAGFTHDGLVTGRNGVVEVEVDWLAPDSGSGGVIFQVTALAADGNRRSSGDGVGETRFSLAYGCDGGMPAFEDFDGDGFGRPGTGQRACSDETQFAPADDDCDDNDETRFPGQEEICNGRDDNCDGETDEGLETVILYEDGDGDGYGRQGGMSKMGCGPERGYGVGNGDCEDDDPDIHPEQEEMCNFIDDDCDGRVDEGARAYCGVGWCRRASSTCEADACTPGQPREEMCNFLDDDCDGETDEGALCDDGEACVEGRCAPSGSGGEGGTGGAGGTGGEGGAGGQGEDMDDTDNGGEGGAGASENDDDGDGDEDEDDRGSPSPAGGCSFSSRSASIPLWGIVVAGLVGWRRRHRAVRSRHPSA